jgi:hypothetical protein
MIWGILQSLEHTRFGVASGAPDTVRCPVCTGHCPLPRLEHLVNWPLSGFLRAIPLKFTGLSGEPPDYPVSQRSNVQLRPTVSIAEVRSQSAKSEHIGLSGAARGHKTSMVNSSKPQRTADVALSGQWTVQCPVHHRTVRCAHRQQ